MAMYHEQHCLLYLHQQIAAFEPPDAHTQHCLHYLRQNILCTLDLTIEGVDYLSMNDTGYKFESARTCKDFGKIHHTAERLDKDWLEYRSQLLKTGI